MATFDFGEIFQQAFGYTPPINQDNVKLEKALARKESSDLGQPYYETDISGREFFLPVKINGMLIPFAIIGMTWKKKIVETDMPERGGSVNELISIEDYVFNIKGILINDDNTFPESGIVDMHNLFKINASVTMRSVLSDIVLKGEYDHKVIIKEIKWPPIAGNEHAKPFEMDLKSDMILDLEID